MKKRTLLIPLCLLLAGCGKTSYNENELPKDAFIRTTELTREIYSKVRVNDLIVDSNVTVIDGNELVDTSSLGEHIYKAIVAYKNNKYNYEIKYKVVDDQAPIIITAPTQVTLYNTTEKSPCDSFVFVDNYDKEPTCTIDGTYDTKKNGTYNLTAVIKDSSGNELQKPFTLTITNEPTKKNSNATTAPVSKTRLNISDVISKHKNDNTMIGIDVSKWQGNIDFNKVKAAGVEFVIMRLGTQTDLQNDISVDTCYEQNIKNAKAAGLKVGVYVATTANTVELAQAQAKWTVKVLNGTKLDFPVAFDFERWTIFRTFKMNLNDLEKVYNAFRDELKNNGYDLMLYSSKWYLENIWPFEDNTTVWLAHYTNETNYTGKYVMWQMSNKGNVDGINTDVDIDIYYKNKE